MYGFPQKTAKLHFQPVEIDRRRPAPLQLRYLAVQARPVAGVIRIEVDADGNTARAARNDRVYISHSGAVAAMVGDGQHGM